MPCLSFGPFELRFYSGTGWSTAEAAFVTARKGGAAQRETAIRTAFKSEHLTELCGEDNPHDTAVVDGVTYTGKTVSGLDKDNPHVITADQVAARAIRNQKLRAAQQTTFTVEHDGDAQSA